MRNMGRLNRSGESYPETKSRQELAWAAGYDSSLLLHSAVILWCVFKAFLSQVELTF